jgi:hypothetical protein
MTAVPASTGLERRQQLVDAGLGQEAQAAEVDAEDRDVAARLRDAGRHPEQRAVAAEEHDEIDEPGEFVARGVPAAGGIPGEAGGLTLVHRLDLSAREPHAQLLELLGGRPSGRSWRRCRLG